MAKNSSRTYDSTVGGHRIRLHATEYAETNDLLEFQIGMDKEGIAFTSLISCFAEAVSIGLRNDIPLATYVEEFTFTRFEPSGMVSGDPQIKMATSLLDYVFRKLAVVYLNRADLAHVSPEILDENVQEQNAGAKFSVTPRKFTPRQELTLPGTRKGYTVQSKMDGHRIIIRTGQYPDGKLGEISLQMHKEGAAFRSCLASFGVAVSIGLQHGVDIAEFAKSFLNINFPPRGKVEGHEQISDASSIIDFIFRELVLSYLGRETLERLSEETPSFDPVLISENPDGMTENSSSATSNTAAYTLGANGLIEVTPSLSSPKPSPIYSKEELSSEFEALHLKLDQLGNAIRIDNSSLSVQTKEDLTADINGAKADLKIPTSRVDRLKSLRTTLGKILTDSAGKALSDFLHKTFRETLEAIVSLLDKFN